MKAEHIARALSGKKVGTCWTACCPAHDDSRPSLSICDRGNKVLVYCHAGCSQNTVITALMERGIWDSRCQANPRPVSHREERQRQWEHRQSNSTEIALSIWRRTIPAANTLVQVYLAMRGLTLPLPPSIRFHPKLKHPCGQVWPCMVALVTTSDEETPVAIHRTYLANNGGGKAPVDTAKLMLGPCGASAVHLGRFDRVLMVGEGIETCLAAMQATGYPSWAAMSTSGLKKLLLPQTVRDVIVLADGDPAGEAAAQECGSRFAREGRRVRLARPPRGKDFNDLLHCGEHSAGETHDVG